MFVLLCYQSNAFHIKHTITCAYKSMQNSRKYTFIQNKREINSRKYKIQENWIWNVLEIDWKEVKITLNGNEINLLTSVIIPFRDKFRARKLIRKQ